MSVMARFPSFGSARCAREGLEHKAGLAAAIGQQELLPGGVALVQVFEFLVQLGALRLGKRNAARLLQRGDARVFRGWRVHRCLPDLYTTPVSRVSASTIS